jgi:thioredoxin-related protein
MDTFMDQEASLARPYGIIGVPTFFFLDEEGIILDVQHALPDDLDSVFQK